MYTEFNYPTWVYETALIESSKLKHTSDLVFCYSNHITNTNHKGGRATIEFPVALPIWITAFFGGYFVAFDALRLLTICQVIILILIKSGLKALGVL